VTFAPARARFSWALAALASFALVLGILPVLAPAVAPAATAANASDFQDGFLISDDNFFDAGSLTASDIQNFLNGKVTSCRGDEGMPCLKDYVAQSTPSLGADSYCRAFGGGTMSAAQLIAAVSQACGISPKVILVMLQKEQALITDPAPSPYQYRAALGQGCPDGAACDPNFAGFFYQVYGAARQFQIYVKNPRWYSYQLGWNNILYQATPPDNDRVCGTKRVNIKNDATRALYIYTPYTPNQAALNNLYGTGDFCSAYGNRNFWRLYTDWFGSPTASAVSGEYARVWASLGGAGGLLGSPTSTEQCFGTYCQQSFRNGTIFWFPGRGVFGVPTVIESMWRNLGFIDGAVGRPTGVVVCQSDMTCTQSFDGGVMAADPTGGNLVGRHVEGVWSSSGGIALGAARGPEVCSGGSQCAQMFAHGALFSGGSATAVTEPVFSAWVQAGASGGSLGFPRSDASCVSAGCTQRFGGGLIASSGRDSAQVVPEPIATKYLRAGGPAGVGGPAGPQTCDSSGACSQRFGSARIDTSSKGTFITMKWFFDAWSAAGFEKGRLGRPLADMACIPATCYQRFSGGTLSGSPSGGVLAVYGAYRDLWSKTGGAGGSLGLPTSSESCNGVNCAQSFQKGVIGWTPKYGAVAVTGRYLAAWQAQGAGDGRLGGPRSAPSCSGSICTQAFQTGVLTTAPSGALVTVAGEYQSVWNRAGGAKGQLGRPVSDESCNGRSCSQVFQNGVIVWTPGSRAVIVSGWFLAPWQAAGSENGRLGAPTAAMVCLPVTCYQAFQGGTLTGSPSAGILPVYGAYRDVWMSAGGPAGTLGLPTRGESCFGSYCRLPFERGTIIWRQSAGALAIAPPVFATWDGAGGVTGRYGLPLAPAVKSGGKVTQSFERGTVSVAG